MLRYADDFLKKDYTIALKAVRQDGMALEFVDDTLKNDEEIAFQAVNQDGTAVQFLPKHML